MIDSEKNVKELAFMIAGTVLFAAAAVLFPPESRTGIAAGYLLGMSAVMIHLAAFLVIRKLDSGEFVESYYLSLLIRFLLILALFTAILLLTKIEQIPFTLSFIISYIFHSVIEVIVIDKSL